MRCSHSTRVHGLSSPVNFSVMRFVAPRERGAGIKATLSVTERRGEGRGRERECVCGGGGGNEGVGGREREKW